MVIRIAQADGRRRPGIHVIDTQGRLLTDACRQRVEPDRVFVGGSCARLGCAAEAACPACRRCRECCRCLKRDEG